MHAYAYYNLIYLYTHTQSDYLSFTTSLHENLWQTLPVTTWTYEIVLNWSLLCYENTYWTHTAVAFSNVMLGK